MKIKTKTAATLIGFLAVLGVLSFASLGAVAYGGQQQQYQVTVSSNCNNVSLCGGRFGEWGWCELGGSGTQGDCEVSFYANTGSGSGSSEALAKLDLTGWTISGGDFVFDSGTATLSGGSIKGPPVTLDLCLAGFCGDTGIPAAPGHYDTTELLGFSAPGIHFNVQVTELH